MALKSARERVDELTPDERDALLVAALDALDWAEMADADPSAAERKGYYERARELRRGVLRDLQRATS